MKAGFALLSWRIDWDKTYTWENIYCLNTEKRWNIKNKLSCFRGFFHVDGEFRTHIRVLAAIEGFCGAGLSNPDGFVDRIRTSNRDHFRYELVRLGRCVWRCVCCCSSWSRSGERGQLCRSHDSYIWSKHSLRDLEQREERTCWWSWSSRLDGRLPHRSPRVGLCRRRQMGWTKKPFWLSRTQWDSIGVGDDLSRRRRRSSTRGLSLHSNIRSWWWWLWWRGGFCRWIIHHFRNLEPCKIKDCPWEQSGKWLNTFQTGGEDNASIGESASLCLTPTSGLFSAASNGRHFGCFRWRRCQSSTCQPTTFPLFLLSFPTLFQLCEFVRIWSSCWLWGFPLSTLRLFSWFLSWQGLKNAKIELR